ncbi:hypothetical protein CLOHYLEM_05781 [[Clostridium] hylemonae DSM 15053]|uniref:Uncharacterized protein n=1 Tax=[Clostridium] hylemonae DSM 15053 TaxID=553973 RepID=C0C0W2_9FIRM|nr:hypothetical protein CLOHYLEM_05781 [[Clostridium] hylemonae DSM 15053]
MNKYVTKGVYFNKNHKKVTVKGQKSDLTNKGHNIIICPIISKMHNKCKIFVIESLKMLGSF